MKLFISILIIATSTLHASFAEDEHHEWTQIENVKKMLEFSHKLIKEITPVELKQKIEDDEEFVLLDIREPGQRGHGDIAYENALQIIRGYLEFKIEKFVPNKNLPIYIYCCSGARSILAAHTLYDMGYKNIKSLKGGMKGWTTAGLPISTHYGDMVLMPENYVMPTNNKDQNTTK